MDDARTMIRTELSIDGHSYFLAQGQDPAELKRRIEAAVQASGAFVDFVVVGNRNVSVLVTAGVPIIFSIETVEYDARDTGDEAVPFGGEWDVIEQMGLPDF